MKLPLGTKSEKSKNKTKLYTCEIFVILIKLLWFLRDFFKKVTTEIAVIWLKGGQFIKGSVLHDTNNGKGERKNRENEESEKRLNEKKRENDWFFVFILAAVDFLKKEVYFSSNVLIYNNDNNNDNNNIYDDDGNCYYTLLL